MLTTQVHRRLTALEAKATARARASTSIAVDPAVAGDSVLLMRAGGITPDDWQVKVLRSTAQRQLMLCCRQSGKSSVAAALALHTALFQRSALVLLLSPSLRQSQELFRKVADAWRALDNPLPTETETTLRLELENGSRILSLPGSEKTIRGYSGVKLLIVDEAARVDDDLYYSIRPMLAVSGGRLICLSTPFGKRGFFHDAWVNGDPSWERVEVPATLCPRISADFLAEEKRALPDLWYRSEYLCEFVELADAVFTYDLIHAALSHDVQPLFAGGNNVLRRS